MATAGKPTAVHFTLAIVVMLLLIVSVVAYIQTREVLDNQATVDKAKSDLQAERQLSTNLDEQIQELKRKIGHELSEVGLDDPQNASTVLGAMQADITKYGGELAEATYSATIVKLREELNRAISERDSLRADLDNEHQQFLTLQSKHQQIDDKYNQAKTQAEQRLQQLISTKEEELRALNDKIATLENEKRTVAEERRTLQDAFDKLKKDSQKEIALIKKQNDILHQKLDEVTKVSFENPDGQITAVDNVGRTVHINLGSADLLNPRTPFAVYAKGHHGVARGKEDIIGQIEVTRIIGPHLAEARILGEDIYKPMSSGDPVYTPLWSPGRQEVFAFVGTIDLDHDGVSDREALHELVKASGGAIDHEVLDDGTRIKYTAFPDEWTEWQDGDTGLNVYTKFLVMGHIPTPTAEDTQTTIEQKEQINQHASDMRNEAIQQGIRIVNLNDFLSWVGYTPRHRLYVPGKVGYPRKLKSGAHSTAVNETVGRRESSGTVSGVFSRSRRLRQGRTDYSSGKTSVSK